MDDNYKTPLIERAIDMAARNHVLAGQAIALPTGLMIRPKRIVTVAAGAL
jgi:hypothetical protein